LILINENDIKIKKLFLPFAIFEAIFDVFFGTLFVIWFNKYGLVITKRFAEGLFVSIYKIK
jgi:hypothetical protein